MLDIKFIRSNPEFVKAAMKNRNADLDETIDRIIAIDEKRRALSAKADAMKAEQNAASREIPRIKKEGGDVFEVMERMKAISEQVKACDAEISALEEEQRSLLLCIPNVPHESVPVGRDDSENVEVRKWGTPREFEFEPKAHWELGSRLNILDPETAAKVTGARFHFYRA